MYSMYPLNAPCAGPGIQTADGQEDEELLQKLMLVGKPRE